MMLRGHAEDGATLALRRAAPKPMRCRRWVKLGYSPGTAAEAVARAARDLGEHSPVDALIREALKGMGR